MELRLKARTTAQRVGIVVLLTLASIAFHEFGHFVVYRLAARFGSPCKVFDRSAM